MLTVGKMKAGWIYAQTGRDRVGSEPQQPLLDGNDHIYIRRNTVIFERIRPGDLEGEKSIIEII